LKSVKISGQREECIQIIIVIYFKDIRTPRTGSNVTDGLKKNGIRVSATDKNNLNFPCELKMPSQSAINVPCSFMMLLFALSIRDNNTDGSEGETKLMLFGTIS
jgi:hypothetical protein